MDKVCIVIYFLYFNLLFLNYIFVLKSKENSIPHIISILVMAGKKFFSKCLSLLYLFLR